MDAGGWPLQDHPAIAPPPAPRTLPEVGLSPVIMRDLLIKTMFRSNLDLAREIARVICLPVPLTIDLINLARSQLLIEASGSQQLLGEHETGFRLTESGRQRALDALAQSEYFGAMPVPLDSYARQMRRQSVRDIRLTRSQLLRGLGHLVLAPQLIDDLGPAVRAGRSILLYGPPGNGKSSISNGLRAALGERIYVPHAIEYSGQVITLYDPIVHEAAPLPTDEPNSLRLGANRFDNRYVYCERPNLVTGGELTLDMLDLKYDPMARTYQAPLQMKASGGIFIVDDLGRQVEPPQKLVNRWIVPLEERHDILALQSGEKFIVPFDTLVIFSTNFHPNQIFDGAALRRIFFKIKVDGPDQRMFLQIFAAVAKKRGIAMDAASIDYLIGVKYPQIGMNFASYQPTFLIDQMIAICDCEEIPRQMTPALIDRAWNNMFVRDEVIAR